MTLTLSDAAPNRDPGTLGTYGGYQSVAVDGVLLLLGGGGMNFGNGDASGAVGVFDINSGELLWLLTPVAGAPLEFFGADIALSGGIAVIGAWGKEDAGYLSGCAYIFNLATGNQVFKLVPDDVSIEDRFGWSVDVDGSLAVIGAPYHETDEIDAGAAYLFDLNSGEQLFKFIPEQPSHNQEFGYDVAVCGDRVLIGAPAFNGPGRAFMYSASTGELAYELHEPERLDFAPFGVSVAMDGGSAVVGGAENGNYPDGGAVYVYDATSGKFRVKLRPLKAMMDSSFGRSVDVQGDRITVGAIRDNPLDCSFLVSPASGAAYVFDATTGEQLARLVPSEVWCAQRIGFSVATLGERAIVTGFDLGREQDNFDAYAHVFAPADCAGDLNADGVTDTADLGMVIRQFNTAETGADVNGDGAINGFDIELILRSFGAVCP